MVGPHSCRDAEYADRRIWSTASLGVVFLDASRSMNSLLSQFINPLFFTVVLIYMGALEEWLKHDAFSQGETPLAET